MQPKDLAELLAEKSRKGSTVTFYIRIAMAAYIAVTLVGSWIVAGWFVPVGVENSVLFQVFMFLPANLIVLTTTVAAALLCAWTAILLKTALTSVKSAQAE